MLTHKGTQTLMTGRLILRRFALEDAEAMMKAGAERLGTSRIVRIAKNQATPNGTY